MDIDPAPGGVYICSSSEAYSEEQRIDQERLGNWLAAFDMALVGRAGEKGYHASGHITGPDLLKLIEAIGPQVIIPVHTEKPGFFRQYAPGACEVIEPKRGCRIELG